jgi:hypothetical protein
MWAWAKSQGTLPIVFLISKQVVPYRTCGGTCHGVTCLALLLAAAQSLECRALEDSQSRWRLTIAIGNK